MVYIVVLNWNNSKDTISCIGSILKSNYKDYKIIICDNDSKDNSINEIIKEYPLISKINNSNKLSKINLIKNDSNLGYAGGNNTAVRVALSKSDCEYVWILNNDTLVKPDTLELLLLKMKSNNKYGLCGSKLVYEHDRTKIQAIGGRYNKWLGKSSHVYAYKDISIEVDEKKIEKSIDYVVGASLFFSKECLNTIGLLAEDYFLYFEELDYAYRIKDRYEVGVASNAIVYHKEGGSTNSGMSPVSCYYSFRNRIKFTLKYEKRYIITVYFFSLLKLINRILKKDFTLANVIIKALLFKDLKVDR